MSQKSRAGRISQEEAGYAVEGNTRQNRGWTQMVMMETTLVRCFFMQVDNTYKTFAKKIGMGFTKCVRFCTIKCLENYYCLDCTFSWIYCNK